MPRRERYEELSKLVEIGAASVDLSDLQEHVDECRDCQKDYEQFADVVFPQLAFPNDPVPNVAHLNSDTDRQSIRARFLKRAQAADISFSPEALNPTLPQLVVPKVARPSNAAPRWFVWSAVATSFVLAAGIGGYQIGWVRAHLKLAQVAEPPNRNADAVRRIAGEDRSSATQSQTSAGASLSRNLDDARHVLMLEQQLSESASQLMADQVQIAALQSDGTSLQGQIDKQQQQLALAEERAQTAEQEEADLKTQLDRARTQASSNQAALLLDELKIKGLNDQLSQSRETLGADREVGSLMAERNLHIVDVFDTDAQGKTKPIFGRIFLVGNKQLLFYAYDLNESRLQNSKYAYRVWGEKLGPGQSAKALGAFYADDSAQRRWVFQYDDAKVLAEIDSVFVTFEPAAKASDHPRGPKLMYAYLRGDANHP
ncbi:MAG TPA: hypothetical protein VFB43_06680 [Terracidiphilus sp.]|nr:hypothetical protein [Terracidiphilus sp.]